MTFLVFFLAILPFFILFIHSFLKVNNHTNYLYSFIYLRDFFFFSKRNADDRWFCKRVRREKKKNREHNSDNHENNNEKRIRRERRKKKDEKKILRIQSSKSINHFIQKISYFTLRIIKLSNSLYDFLQSIFTTNKKQNKNMLKQTPLIFSVS